MTDGTSVVYTEYKKELSWLIELGIFYEENQISNDVIDHTNVVYAKNEIESLWSIKPGVVCNKN